MDQLVGQYIDSRPGVSEQSTVQGRYRIESLLGKQTGRRTYLATDNQTEHSVVVKLVLFGPDFTWEDMRLFEREAETLKSLDHPAIPSYLDSFEVDTALGKGFALVQTHIAARSLREVVAAGRTFSEQDLIAIARQILQILNYLHHRYPPVIHRDIKPSNILLTEQPNGRLEDLYLVDFGSVQSAPSSGTMTIVGTYGYMPIEQFSGRAMPASDLYSLGATLLFLATGRHPSEMVQPNLQLDYEQHVRFTPAFTHWIKQLICIELSNRTASAEQAMETLKEVSSIPKRTEPTATPSPSIAQDTSQQPRTLEESPSYLHTTRLTKSKVGRQIEQGLAKPPIMPVVRSAAEAGNLQPATPAPLTVAPEIRPEVLAPKKTFPLEERSSSLNDLDIVSAHHKLSLQLLSSRLASSSVITSGTDFWPLSFIFTVLWGALSGIFVGLAHWSAFVVILFLGMLSAFLCTSDLWKVWFYLRRPNSTGQKTNVDIWFPAGQPALLDFLPAASASRIERKNGKETTAPHPVGFPISSVKISSFGYRLLFTFTGDTRKKRVLTIYGKRQEIRLLSKYLARYKRWPINW